MTSGLYELAYAVAYITFALGVLSSVARFYSRALVVKSWGWDDTASCAVLVRAQNQKTFDSRLIALQ